MGNVYDLPCNANLAQCNATELADLLAYGKTFLSTLPPFEKVCSWRRYKEREKGGEERRGEANDIIAEYTGRDVRGCVLYPHTDNDCIYASLLPLLLLHPPSSIFDNV